MTKTLLILECSPELNWYVAFGLSPCLPSGEELRIEQAEWGDVSLTAYSDSGCVVALRRAKNPLPGTSQTTNRSCKPDFILFRTVTRTIGHLDSTNLLYAFKFANIPTVNSLESILLTLEKPWIYGELRKIQMRIGNGKFPLIKQIYYPTHKNMIIAPDFPCVIKIGSCHAGYGKIKVADKRAFDDVRSIVALHDDYCTAERFIEWDYDLRVQKIGSHYRAFSRKSANWKGNVGNEAVNEDAEVTEEFKIWIDECSRLFGGLDICAVDAVHCEKDDTKYILELNDTAIGLVHRHEKEDMEHIRDLVLMRMSQHFTKNEEKDVESKEGDSDEPHQKRIEELEKNVQEEINKSERLRQQVEEQKTVLEDQDKKKCSVM